jgi:curved DNA-binding protein
MEFKDYYGILGVPRNASKEDIQKSYRKLARDHHPDVNKTAGSDARFKEIGEAYDVLKDPQKRTKYDRYGAAWKAAAQGGQAPPGFGGAQYNFSGAGSGQHESFYDLLDQMFGGRGHARAGGRSAGSAGFGWSARGQDHEASLRVTMEEAACGGPRRVTLTDPNTGAGRTFDLNLPAGSLPGQRIRLSGQGGQGQAGGASGDLYLVLAFESHPRFRLEARDLHTTLAISPWEAALGAGITVETLEGTVKARVPAGTSSGKRIRLKGKGFPGKEGSGDLYIAIEIEVPKKLSDDERRLYEELSRVSEEGPGG